MELSLRHELEGDDLADALGVSRSHAQALVSRAGRRRELTPALLAGLAPRAALSPGFRDRLLRVMADRTPAGMAHRLGVANRAGPFGPHGFPKPVTIGRPARRRHCDRSARDLCRVRPGFRGVCAARDHSGHGCAGVSHGRRDG